MTHTTDLHEPLAVEAAAPARRAPFGPKLAATALVLGAGGNTLQPLLGHLAGGRPDTVSEQAALAAEHTGLVLGMSLSGTLAVPFMALGFVAAAHLLYRRAPRTAVVAGTLLLLGMWGFMAVQTTELLQVVAVLDGPYGMAAAEWMQSLDSSWVLNAVFGLPFMLGCVLGMLTLTIGLLVKGAGVPRWIPAAWLAFILLDFSIGAVGPVDPHWLYFLGALGFAAHILRDGGRTWTNA
ncbi:MAG: hypothetical protein ACTHKG_06465 [Nocardioides sp.]